MKPTHGGKRKNAGRKEDDAVRGLRPYSVSLDRSTVTKARKLGEGELSRGIRKKFRDA